MRIGIYLQNLDETGHPTGVGKHSLSMTRGLAATPGFDIQLMTPRQLLRDGRIPQESLYAGLPVRGLPLPPRYLNRLWLLLGQPRIEYWCPGADWVYSTVELYVPTRRAKLAVTVHDLAPLETDLPWSDSPANARVQTTWRFKMPRIVRRAHLLLAVSEFTRQRLIALLGARPDQVAVVGNGVEEPFYAVAREPMGKFQRPEGPYVLNVGGLSVRKSGAELLALARAMRERAPELRLVVAGMNEPQFAAQAATLPNVVLLGYVPQESLPGLMRGAVALVVFSRYEGFGIPAAEAMAAGTPVVAANLAALPEVVGDAGFLVDITQSDTVAEIVMRLARDPALRAQYAQKGHQRATGFTWDGCVERLVRALRERS